MNLLDKLKLIIEAKSFYMKKARISEFEIISLPHHYEKIEDIFRACGLEFKRILKYYKDEMRLEYVIWYI